MQSVKRVNTRNSTADQPRHPEAIGIITELFRVRQLLHPNHVHHADRIESEVAGIAELTAGSEVAKDRVDGGFVVDGDGGGFEVLDEFADTEDFPGGAELLLGGVEGVDGGLGTVGAVEVPGVETGEVLDCSEDLVTADFGVLVFVG